MADPAGPATERARDMLRLLLLPGLGPIRADRLLGAFGGSAERALGASHAAWQAVPGIGPVIARRAMEAIGGLGARVERELALASASGTRLIARGDQGYPPLLAELDDAPQVLYIRGDADFAGTDRYPVAIVGSRRCTQYGIEQSERFGGVLGRAGLTIVSGGARGIDTAAHRGAIRSGGRTIVVQGCGLGRSYPPENAGLFDRVIAEGSGAIVSELPMETEPKGEHFPARNRIISGLSLGVLVIEAATKSGALITARLAAEDHGREVMVVPGRVDSQASAGSLMLLKIGGAALVTEPGDVLDALEAPARFAHDGAHGARYLGATGPGAAPVDAGPSPTTASTGSDDVSRVLAACVGGSVGLDELARSTGIGVERVRVALTVLELGGRVRRSGGRFDAVQP
jgi:DNA processing protein